MLQEIKTIVKELANYDTLYLGEPIKIKVTPHSYAFFIHAIRVFPENQLYVMDYDIVDKEQWFEVTERDPKELIETLYQRLLFIQHEYNKPVLSLAEHMMPLVEKLRKKKRN